METLTEARDRLRRERQIARVARWLFFAWIAVLLVIGGRFDGFAPLVVVLAAPAWLVMSYLSFRARTQMCPKCHLELARTIHWRRVLGPECPHCGMAIEGENREASA